MSFVQLMWGGSDGVVDGPLLAASQACDSLVHREEPEKPRLDRPSDSRQTSAAHGSEE